MKYPLIATFACLALASPAALAAAAAPEQFDELRAMLAERMDQINQQQRELLERMQQVEEQRRELELMLARVQDLDAYRGGQAAGGAADTPVVVGQEQQAEREAQQERPPELPRISAEVGGVLTPRGRLVLEPAVQYTTNTVTRVGIEGFTILPALLVGVIDVNRADRETFQAALTARYGITNRLEMELRGSWVSREDETQTRQFLTDSVEDEFFDAEGDDWGDAELGLRYQFNRGIGWPFMIGNLRVKSDTGTDPFEIATQSILTGEPQFAAELPTGSGFWSVNPSLTFISPSDPVAFYGNVGYLWSLEDDKGTVQVTNEDGETVTQGFGEVDPGDAWRFSFGMGVALNDRSSFSLGYSLDIFDKTRIETAAVQDIPGSDVKVGKLLIGYSIRLPGGGAPLNLAVGIGTTDAAPDSDLTFRVPFNFFQ